MEGRNAAVELLVGILLLLGFGAMFILAFKVSNLSNNMSGPGYTVTANFDNIGGLRPRAPVRVAGVKVGTVESIELNHKLYKAVVTMWISKDTEIPVDSSASILTEGLLGANYVGLTPGFEEEYLQNKGHIDITHPALVLENLIGQLVFNMNDKKDDN